MKIAIITGGISGERSVSISSAKNVEQLLDFAKNKIFVFPEDIDDFLNQHGEFDLAIPIIHGEGGEDGSVQGLLKNLNLPYIFSGIEAHAIGIDKKRTKQIVQMLGYPTPKEVDKTNFPFFAKPRFGGSSVNSGLCKNESAYIKLAKISEELILEEPIQGREFTVGIVEYNSKTTILPIIEIITPEDTFFDYESKYNTDKLAQEICPAIISKDLEEDLKRIALDVHRELGIKHISRSDFIVTKAGKPYFLEINTIPGMTDTSLIPKMLKSEGINFRDLLKEWCESNI